MCLPEPSTLPAQVWKRFGLLVNLDTIQDVRDEDAEALTSLSLSPLSLSLSLSLTHTHTHLTSLSLTLTSLSLTHSPLSLSHTHSPLSHSPPPQAHAHAGPGGASSAPGGLRTCRALVIGPEYQPLRKLAEETVERLKVSVAIRATLEATQGQILSQYLTRFCWRLYGS